jgi:flagellin-specific chaperone FliS
MVEITMQITDRLAQRLQPLYDWLPTILELSLVGFKTPAVQTVSEIIEFLATSPSPNEVLDYHVSERAQTRLQRLLAINAAGLASAEEQAELDEIGQIEHIIIMLKAQAQEKITRQN